MGLRRSTATQWFIALCLLPFTVSVLPSRRCVQKWLDADRMVCVCNSTYCDTVDIPTLSDGQFVQYTSNKAGLRFHEDFGQFQNTPNKKDLHLAIDVQRTYQTILGFGAAFTDSAGINIKSLSQGAQEKLLKSYFSPQGIELSFGRVPIAGSDFSTHTYTYDEVEGDTRLDHFNLTYEDYQYKIPIIKRVMSMSAKRIHLLAAAWTSPPWMKTNHDYSGFGFLKDEFYQPWANYHIKFLDAYQREGLSFWGISTGNEPSNGIIPINRFNSLGWTPGSQMKWVRENLGPSLKNSQHTQTKLLVLDDQRFMLPFWIHSMQNDLRAAQYIDGIAVHWYWDTIVPPFLLDVVKKEFPDKFILATEACVGDKPWDFKKVLLGSWERGEHYMEDIIEDLNHWVAGWLDWNLALDRGGGPNWANNFVDSPVIVNAGDDEFYKQPMFYALGHFSKFVLEGSVRVDIAPSNTHGVHSIAFRTPKNEIVIILYNSKSAAKQLTITDPDRGHINLMLTGKSFQTIIYQ